MLLALGFFVACFATTSLITLAATQILVFRSGRRVFYTHRALAVPNRVKDVLTPIAVAAMLAGLAFAGEPRGAQLVLLLVVGGGWLLLMWSAFGFLFVLFHVCLVGRLNPTRVARGGANEMLGAE